MRIINVYSIIWDCNSCCNGCCNTIAMVVVIIVANIFVKFNNFNNKSMFTTLSTTVFAIALQWYCNGWCKICCVNYRLYQQCYVLKTTFVAMILQFYCNCKQWYCNGYYNWIIIVLQWYCNWIIIVLQWYCNAHCNHLSIKWSF